MMTAPITMAVALFNAASPCQFPLRTNSGSFATLAAIWPLPQFVAIDDCARIARHIVEDAALHERVYARVTE